MAEQARKTTWSGGLVRYGQGGRAVYVIREQKNGRRWTITLDKRSEEEAEAELALFRRDPALYAREVARHRAEGAAEPVRLDDATKLAFLEHGERCGREKDYLHELKRYLTWWQERIGGIDLRCKGLSLAVLKDALRGCATAEPQRIATIKVFLSWLRAEGKIKAEDDPTLFGALKVPPARPAKRGDKGDVQREHVVAAIDRLKAGQGNLPVYGNMLLLQAGTGWHTTEVLRFMADGKIETLPRNAVRDGVAGVVVCPQRKSGEEQRTPVSTEVLTAAKRLRLHGAFLYEHGDRKGERRTTRSVRDGYDQALARACVSANVPVFTGAMMRHTNATAQITAGADPAAVSAFLGHKDKRTTMRFYARHGVVPKPVGTLF